MDVEALATGAAYALVAVTPICSIICWAREVRKDDPRKLTIHHFLSHEPRPWLWGLIPIPALPTKKCMAMHYLREELEAGGDRWLLGKGPTCSECGYLNSTSADWVRIYGNYGNSKCNRMSTGIYTWTDVSALVSVPERFKASAK